MDNRREDLMKFYQWLIDFGDADDVTQSFKDMRVDDFIENNKAENLPISDVSPRYFKIQAYDGGQKESPIIIKGKNKTEAISEFRMKNPNYMNRHIDFICEINED